MQMIDTKPVGKLLPEKQQPCHQVNRFSRDASIKTTRFPTINGPVTTTKGQKSPHSNKTKPYSLALSDLENKKLPPLPATSDKFAELPPNYHKLQSAPVVIPARLSSKSALQSNSTKIFARQLDTGKQSKMSSVSSYRYYTGIDSCTLPGSNNSTNNITRTGSSQRQTRQQKEYHLRYPRQSQKNRKAMTDYQQQQQHYHHHHQQQQQKDDQNTHSEMGESPSLSFDNSTCATAKHVESIGDWQTSQQEPTDLKDQSDGLSNSFEYHAAPAAGNVLESETPINCSNTKRATPRKIPNTPKRSSMPLTFSREENGSMTYRQNKSNSDIATTSPNPPISQYRIDDLAETANSLSNNTNSDKSPLLSAPLILAPPHHNHRDEQILSNAGVAITTPEATGSSLRTSMSSTSYQDYKSSSMSRSSMLNYHPPSTSSASSTAFASSGPDTDPDPPLSPSHPVMHDSSHNQSYTHHKVDPAERRRIVAKYNAVREFVKTEVTFATDLAVIVDVYIGKLMMEPFFGYVCQRDVATLASNVDRILQLSRQFVAILKEKVPAYIMEQQYSSCQDDHPIVDIDTGLADAILEYIPKMEREFKYYCDHNLGQTATYNRIKNLASPVIDLWLKECFEQSQSMTTAWTLDSLLIKPVQRLLKYPLLMERILKSTPQGHSEYEILQHASTSIQFVAERINTSQEPSSSSRDDNNNHDAMMTSESRQSTDSTTATYTTNNNANLSYTSTNNTTTNTNSNNSNNSSNNNNNNNNSNTTSSSHSSRSNIAKPPVTGTGMSFEEENKILLQLKYEHTADFELERLLQKFKVKQKQVRDIVEAIKASSENIQRQFDCNNRLAKSWFSWVMAINPMAAGNAGTETSTAGNSAGLFGAENDLHISAKTRLYKNYTLFSAPFTSSSSSEFSSGQLAEQIYAKVTQNLEQLLDMYASVQSLIELRQRYHVSYSRYIRSKKGHQLSSEVQRSKSNKRNSSPGSGRRGTGGAAGFGASSSSGNNSQGVEEVDSKTQNEADEFVKLHNALKDGLPDLFQGSEPRVAESLKQFVRIQSEWFQFAANSLADVFQIDVEDIKDTSGETPERDPIVDSHFKRHNYIQQQGLASGLSVDKLSIVSGGASGAHHPHPYHVDQITVGSQVSVQSDHSNSKSDFDFHLEPCTDEEEISNKQRYKNDDKPSQEYASTPTLSPSKSTFFSMKNSGTQKTAHRKSSFMNFKLKSKQPKSSSGLTTLMNEGKKLAPKKSQASTTTHSAENGDETEGSGSQSSLSRSSFSKMQKKKSKSKEKA